MARAAVKRTSAGNEPKGRGIDGSVDEFRGKGRLGEPSQRYDPKARSNATFSPHHDHVAPTQLSEAVEDGGSRGRVHVANHDGRARLPREGTPLEPSSRPPGLGNVERPVRSKSQRDDRRIHSDGRYTNVAP